MAWKLTPAGRGGSTHPPKGQIGTGTRGTTSTHAAKGVVGKNGPLGTTSTKPVSRTGKQPSPHNLGGSAAKR